MYKLTGCGYHMWTYKKVITCLIKLLRNALSFLFLGDFFFFLLTEKISKMHNQHTLLSQCSCCDRPYYAVSVDENPKGSCDNKGCSVELSSIEYKHVTYKIICSLKYYISTKTSRKLPHT